MNKDLKPLKMIGMWKSEWETRFPDPHDFVNPDWEKDRKSKIVHYLKSGKRYLEAMGFSFCRFKCGMPDEGMGNADLTDGEWLWPEGLAHYIEWHNVVLPGEFILTMEQNAFRIPTIMKLVDPFHEEEAFGGSSNQESIEFCRTDAWELWADVYLKRKGAK